MKVQVLISAYDSVRFFPEQLDTVLKQEGVEVSILIRDDGSKNLEMEEIIRTYQNNYPDTITYYQGDNTGPAASFIELIKKSDDTYDYYAFCDHDDLWDKDKLKSAVEQLATLDVDQPNCCFCNYRMCNEEGNIIGYSNVARTQTFTVRNLILSNPAPGCCIVFNKKARDLIAARPTPRTMVMHDGWMILLCSMLGNVVFDGEPRISYRQHRRNTVGIATTWMQRVRFKVNYIMNKANRNRHCIVYCEFKHFYGALMCDKEKKKILELLCGYSTNLWKRIRLVCSRKVVSYNCKVTLFFKFLVLVNRW